MTGAALAVIVPGANVTCGEQICESRSLFGYGAWGQRLDTSMPGLGPVDREAGEGEKRERAVADVAVAASEDDTSKSCHAKSRTTEMRQAECRTCQRMEASDPKVVPDIGASQTSPSNTLPAILQKPLLRPMQGLCAAVGEIPPWYRKWLKIAISSFARASERLSKLRNIRYRELAMPHRPLLPHPLSWIKPPAQSPNHTSICSPSGSQIFCQSHAHLHAGKPGKDFQARHASIKFLQARLVSLRPKGLSYRCQWSSNPPSFRSFAACCSVSACRDEGLCGLRENEFGRKRMCTSLIEIRNHSSGSNPSGRLVMRPVHSRYRKITTRASLWIPIQCQLILPSKVQQVTNNTPQVATPDNFV
jgi:hypothetical protein